MKVRVRFAGVHWGSETAIRYGTFWCEPALRRGPDVQDRPEVYAALPQALRDGIEVELPDPPKPVSEAEWAELGRAYGRMVGSEVGDYRIQEEVFALARALTRRECDATEARKETRDGEAD